MKPMILGCPGVSRAILPMKPMFVIDLEEVFSNSTIKPLLLGCPGVSRVFRVYGFVLEIKGFPWEPMENNWKTHAFRGNLWEIIGKLVFRRNLWKILGKLKFSVGTYGKH